MKLIIGNWKCNPKTLAEAKKLFGAVEKGIRGTKNKVIICPPFIYLGEFKIQNSKLKIQLGAQDCFWENNGPYTGEVSPSMLRSLRVAYVIIGHSERRVHLNETDEIINKKLKAALKVGLKSILCIGEKRGESAEKVIDKQLKNDLKGLSVKEISKIIVAYEPVWAIGTGNFCPPEKAKKTLKFIKSKINNKILYGGSVNSKISKSYTRAGFDGLLVGGASLNANEFIKIVKNA